MCGLGDKKRDGDFNNRESQQNPMNYAHGTKVSPKVLTNVFEKPETRGVFMMRFEPGRALRSAFTIAKAIS
jgi:hypothetical protein